MADMEKELTRSDMLEPGFTEDNIIRLAERIQSFKTYVSLSLAQKSNWAFSKFHILQHDVEDVKDLGLLQALFTAQ